MERERMKSITRMFWILAAAFWLAGCASPAASSPAAVVATIASPAWVSTTLTDAVTAKPFRLKDEAGRVVLVEDMATWCPNCLQQQRQVVALHRALGESSGLVSVGLDVDPHEDQALLKSYVQKEGFTWTYAIAPSFVGHDLGQLYGDQFLNPSATPMLVIDRQGQVHPLPFGIKSADTLQKDLQPYLNG